jgi:predicted ATPase
VPGVSAGQGIRPLPIEGLLERGTEYRALIRALTDLLSGRGHVVAVVGPAGVGKTAIGKVALSLATEAGAQVLRARGAELEQQFAFGVVRQLCQRLAKSATPEERDELFADAAAGARAALDPQLPTTGARGPA